MKGSLKALAIQMLVIYLAAITVIVLINLFRKKGSFQEYYGRCAGPGSFAVYILLAYAYPLFLFIFMIAPGAADRFLSRIFKPGMRTDLI